MRVDKIEWQFGCRKIRWAAKQRSSEFANQRNHGFANSQIKSAKHGRCFAYSRFWQNLKNADQRNQFVAEGSNLLVKVGPHSVSLIPESDKIRKTRISETVPNICLVLLVRARPRCHALPVLPAACVACGLWLWFDPWSRDLFAPFHWSRDLFAPFLTVFYGKVCLLRLLFPFRLSH